MTDEINIKVSGTAVYKAVKQYLDNSDSLKKEIEQYTNKYLEQAVKSRIDSIISGLETQAKYKIKTEIDVMVKKEVEQKIATYISNSVKKVFEV